MRKPAKQGGGTGLTVPIPPPVVRHAPHHPASKATPPVQGRVPGTTVPVKPKPRKPPVKKSKRRKWSPGADVACCAAEAVGVLVEASGRPWSAEQTLALYFSTASDPDAGASIEDTLRAACQVFPCAPRGKRINGVTAEVLRRLPHQPAVAGLVSRTWQPQSLILGVQLEEPHAVAVTPDGTWHSWGQPFNPADWPGLVIEEAWALWPR